MDLEERFSVIVLAAGAASRLGRDKATLPWGRSTLLVHVIEQFPAACTSRRLVVLNPGNERAARKGLPGDVEFAINPEPKAEMIRSIRIGVSCLSPVRTVVCIHPVDVFAVSQELVMRLWEAWRAAPGRIHMPEVGGKGGHPVVLPPELVPEIERIPIGCGLDWLLRRQAEVVSRHPWHDERLLADIDTPDDYARYRPQTELGGGRSLRGSSPRGGT
jgi:molybdenum cofactor cytidylyltransferase